MPHGRSVLSVSLTDTASAVRSERPYDAAVRRLESRDLGREFFSASTVRQAAVGTRDMPAL